MARTPQKERRAQLVTAAKHVMLTRGLSQVTVREVAQEASASVASVHYAFRDKDELVEEALQALMGDFEESVITPVARCSSLQEAVECLLTGYWQWLTATPKLERVVTDAGLRPAHADQPTSVAMGLEMVRRALAAHAEDCAVDLDEFAHLLLVIIDGATLVYAVEGDADRVRVSLQHAIRAIRAVCEGNPRPRTN